MACWYLSLAWWWQIAVAAAVSLGFGHLFVGGLHRWGQNALEPEVDRDPQLKAVWYGFGFGEHRPKDWDPKGPGSIRAWVTGFVERLVFMTFVAFDPTAAVVAMGAWIGLKMAANWNKAFPTKYPDDPVRELNERQKRASGAFLAVLTGLLSMFFAALGGLLLHWAWKPTIG